MKQINLVGQHKANLGVADITIKEIVVTTKDASRFNVNKTPFKAFFIERVLDNMLAVDKDREEDGSLKPDEVIDYTVSLNGNDCIDKIIIKNYGGIRRERELIASIRWTLDKMLLDLS